MGKQTFVVRVHEGLARDVLQFLARAGHGYRTLDEFAEVALLNQLSAESASGEAASGSAVTPARPAPALHALAGAVPASRAALLAPVEGAPAVRVAENAVRPEGELFVLTNRFGPMKAGLRVLANLSRSGEWPEVVVFQEESARAARELGLRLRAEDSIHRRPAAQRRWIGFPVGQDERAALDRFVFSFAITGSGASPAGPLAMLGLAAIVDSRVALTEAGWALAVARSPLIDGGATGTLSQEESGIIRAQIASSPGELAAVLEFLDVVKRAAGRQPRVNDLLSQRRRSWTADYVSAHRASMAARLAELGAVSITGRGSKAVLAHLPAAEEFRLLRRREANETVA
jgi:hypothetical protein